MSLEILLSSEFETVKDEFIQIAKVVYVSDSPSKAIEKKVRSTLFKSMKKDGLFKKFKDKEFIIKKSANTDGPVSLYWVAALTVWCQYKNYKSYIAYQISCLQELMNDTGVQSSKSR